MASVHRLTTGCVPTWRRPSSTAAASAATAPPLGRLGPWPTWLASSSQRTGQFTAAQSWLFTGCLQTPTTASSCATKAPSRSVVQLHAAADTAQLCRVSKPLIRWEVVYSVVLILNLRKVCSLMITISQGQFRAPNSCRCQLSGLWEEDGVPVSMQGEHAK